MSAPTPRAQTPPLFTALATSIRPLHDVLRCINFKQQALVRISEDGVRVSVEDSRSLQAHAFLENTLFSTYKFTRPPDPSASGADVLSFSISLVALMELLSIYNPASQSAFTQSSTNVLRMSGTLRLSYREYGAPLDLTLDENGVVTTCSLTTYEPDTHLDLDLIHDPVPDKIIMRSGWLLDALQELDSHTHDTLTVRQSPTRPWFRLSVKGILGSAQMDYPNDRSVLETFNCAADVKNSYRFSMIRNCLRAMAASEKVSVRTDEVGTLGIQFMISVGEGRYSFVEFKMLALDEDDEERELEDDGDQNTANETLDF